MSCLFLEPGAGYSDKSMWTAQVSRWGETVGSAQQVVRPSLPCQWARSEEDGCDNRQRDRCDFTEAPWHLEEKSLSDGQRWTAQLCEALNEPKSRCFCVRPTTDNKCPDNRWCSCCSQGSIEHTGMHCWQEDNTRPDTCAPIDECNFILNYPRASSVHLHLHVNLKRSHIICSQCHSCHFVTECVIDSGSSFHYMLLQSPAAGVKLLRINGRH